MSTSGCVPFKVYCSMYGESIEQVNMRIHRGLWIKGREYHTIPGVRGRWIDLDAVSEWVREQSKV